MKIPWQRRPTSRTRRLLAAAGLGAGSYVDDTVFAPCRDVAYLVSKRDSSALEPVLAIAEDMLLDQANHQIVLSLLEDIQNLVSHGLEAFSTPEEVTALLGPKSTVCWETLTAFWNSVAAWCAESDVALDSSERLLGIENEELRRLLWTASRTHPTGGKLGLHHAVQFEQDGQPPIPGFSHIAAAMDSLRESSA